VCAHRASSDRAPYHAAVLVTEPIMAHECDGQSFSESHL
jgi:hypothetical protein